MRPLIRTLTPVLLLLAAGCATRTSATTEPAAPAVDKGSAFDSAGERYTKLVLALGQHDAAYVDAFYGPKEWAEEAAAAKIDLSTIGERAAALTEELQATAEPTDPLVALRRRYLIRQLQALSTRVQMLQGKKLAFDEESLALYDARSPDVDEQELKKALAALDAALPGEGAVGERLNAYRERFALPKDKLDPVFRTAIAEARRRTLQHLTLPKEETFTLEFVSGKPWGGYNWYQGNAKSLIQINTDIPIHPWRAIDLAAHEGYPGHHAYNVMLEQHLVRERGWVEFTVYALFSPQSLIAEGSANYGIDVAFPDATAFARDVLFPMAGLDPSEADNYVRVEKLTKQLEYAHNEAGRRYLDGKFTREQARDWLVQYGLMTPERAEKRMDFIDTYRTYIINYNVGREIVREWVERNGGGPKSPERQWELFRMLLASPRLPSDLK